MELSSLAACSIFELDLAEFTLPTYTFRPRSLVNNVEQFKSNLPVTILYAVKTNPEPFILKALSKAGIRNFDVASLDEIELIHSLVDFDELFFMHPIKSSHAIQKAYFEYGVRHYSFDDLKELDKILEATNHATDLTLHLRIATKDTEAKINLSNKFGISIEDAPMLLEKASEKASRLGVSFHVGSQCMEPLAYYRNIVAVSKMLETLNCPITYFNIGGGFPSIYPGLYPPPMTDYFDQIKKALNAINQNYIVLAEPGRCLVAETMSLIVKVELRRGNLLYINDGTYGGLFDAGHPQFTFPIRKINGSPHHDEPLTAYSLYGPTCDAYDFMPGPFYLPDDIQENDYLEIGQVGAYSSALSSNFNGFRHNPFVYAVEDKPILSMHLDKVVQKIQSKICHVAA